MPSMFRSPFDVSSTSSDSSSASPSPRRTPRSPPIDIPERKPYQIRQDGVNTTTTARPKAITRLTSALNMSSLQPQQRQGLLQLAFLEARCRETAWAVLNQDRRPDQLLAKDDPLVEAEAQRTYAELVPGFAHSLGLPDELTGPAGKQLRHATLSGLDSILINSTSARVSGIDSPNIPSNQLLQPGPIPTSSDDTNGNGLHSISNSFKQVALGSPSLFGGLPSPYKSEHEELCMLGKGGYGQVWKVKNHLDNQLYAVKKIVISSQRLEKYSQSDQVEALLEELRTLAKLHHTNVVRYYHGWIERTDPSRPASGGQSLLEGPSTTNSSSRAEWNVTIDDISGTCTEIRKDSQHYHDSGSFGTGHVYEVEEGQSDGIVFGEDSSAPDSETRFTADRERTSRGTSSSTRTFTKASLLSVGPDDDDSDIENISRSLPKSPNLGRQVSLAHVPYASNLPREPPTYVRESTPGPDITLFIKMSLHPITLSAILSPDPPREDDSIKMRHCFHQKPSIAMLSAILDGIEYLHSQRIVHRDLKPANIFLSVDTDRPPATRGFVDVIQCTQCAHEKSRHVYLTPCIGDFGLIAEMKDPAGTSETTPDFQASTSSPGSQTSVNSVSGSTLSFEPSPLARLRQSHRPVGTQFYRPAEMPKSEPRICPKLDVYSLGVIAFELMYKFGTRTERAMLLNDLCQGRLPKDFDAKMAEGIRGMTCADRDRRWGCREVREWLTSF